MKRSPTGTVMDPGGPGIAGGPVQRDPNNPAILGKTTAEPGPFLHPGVSDPAAIRYAQNAETRRRPPAVPVPRYSEPVAGGPDLPIPLLTNEAGTGTMEEQARMQRGLPRPALPGLDRLISSTLPAVNRAPTAPLVNPGIVEGTAHTQPITPPTPARSGGLSLPAGLQRDDMLTEQVQKDPSFQQGQGSMYAANQPHLAFKYGVMRGGKFIAPPALKQTPTQKTGQLSEQAIADLQTIADLQSKRQKAEHGPSVDQQVADEAAQGPAGGAGKTNKPLTDAEKAALFDEMDEFDMSRMKSALFKDLLNNDEQRRIIEARLKPLDLTDLIVTGQVTQTVPVVPGVFVPVFQSYAGEEDLSVKRLIGEEIASLKPSDRYALDKYQLMGLTVALVSINNLQFPDYRDAEGKFDEDAFWAKYALVSRLNYHMMASLMVNWFWFDMRVRRLFKAEELGNG